MLRNHGTKRGLSLVLLALAAALVLAGILLTGAAGGGARPSGVYEPSTALAGFEEWEDRSIAEAELEPYYAKVLAGWEEAGVPKAATRISIPAGSPAAVSDATTLQTGSYEGKDDVLIWESKDTHWVEYEVQVEEEGLYEMHVQYHPLMGDGYTRPIVLDVSIDGVRPFRESSAITLYRLWQDQGEIKTNDDGDEIRPVAQDISTWMTHPLVDSGANYAEPFLWHLTSGTHTLRLEGYEPDIEG